MELCNGSNEFFFGVLDEWNLGKLRRKYERDTNNFPFFRIDNTATLSDCWKRYREANHRAPR